MTPAEICTALEAHAAECRKAIAELRPRPALPANLAGAYLARAYLAGAKGVVDVVTIAPIGSRRACLTATKGEYGSVRLTTGCFAGSLDDFAKAVEREHGGNEHGDAYRAAIALIRARFGVAAEVAS